MLRKTYAVVDLACIRHNIVTLKKLAQTSVMAVIKADAYGHGMVEVAKTAQTVGVNWFGVATPDEAIQLRAVFGDVNILVFSPIDEEATAILVKENISICAFSPEQINVAIRAAKAYGNTAKIHVKIDTGMNRVGLRTMEELQAMLALFKNNPQIVFEGVFTHFALADSKDKTFAGEQLNRFNLMLASIKKAGFSPIRHAANSAAIIAHENAHFDLCRMGIAMYGYAPSSEMVDSCKTLKPALSLISHVTQVKRIYAGDKVSYGGAYVAKSEETLFTIPIGYADGYRRGFSQKSWAYIHGEKAFIAGRVCMDQTMFHTDKEDIAVGDEVVLLGEGISAEDLAGLCDTISYEILTGISGRVPRIYVYE